MCVPTPDQRGQKLFAVVAQCLSAFLQHGQGVQQNGRVIGEDLGGHRAAQRLLGLVGKLPDPAVSACLHIAEARGLLFSLQVGGDHGDAGPGLHMGLDHLTVVQAVHMIGAEDQQHVGSKLPDQRSVLRKGVRVAMRELAVLVLRAGKGWQDHQPPARAVQVPGPAARQVVVQAVRQVLLDDPHVLHTAVDQIAQREIDQPVGAQKRHGRLGPLVGQRGQPAAPPSRKHDGKNLLTGNACSHAGSVSQGACSRVRGHRAAL
ncbi:hypothetical protein DEDE109153_10490 [Deinococcus deserti]